MVFGDEMIFKLMANWHMALGGFLVFFCFLTLIFLVRNRRKSNLADMKWPLTETTREFNTEVTVQSIKQQADQVFDAILIYIQREKENLERLLEATQVENRSKTAKFSLPRVDRPQPVGEARFTMGQRESAGDAHQAIEALAVKGIGAEEIAAQLKVPLAEVELLLKIKKESFKQSAGSTA